MVSSFEEPNSSTPRTSEASSERQAQTVENVQRTVLRYATIPPRNRSGWRVFIYLLPVWCYLLAFGPVHVLGHDVNYLWWAATVLPLAVAVICEGRNEHKLVWYCIAIAAVIGAVGIILPMLNT